MSGYKGLHLRVESPQGFKHGIGDGQGGVYTTIQTANGVNCMIVRKSLPDFSGRKKIEIVSYDHPKHSREEIINLVKYALVEDIRFNSGAEFINWAVLGKKRIKEVQYSVAPKDDIQGLKNLGLFVGASTVAAIAVGYVMKKVFEKK